MSGEVENTAEHGAEAETAPYRRHGSERECRSDPTLAQIDGATNGDEDSGHSDGATDGDGAEEPGIFACDRIERLAAGTHLGLRHI